MCSYLCRLDIAICLRKRKEQVPCFGRQRGKIYRWQIWSDCLRFGLKGTTVTELVSQTEGKYRISHMDCCHAIKLVTNSATENTRANHFLRLMTQ